MLKHKAVIDITFRKRENGRVIIGKKYITLESENRQVTQEEINEVYYKLNESFSSTDIRRIDITLTIENKGFREFKDVITVNGIDSIIPVITNFFFS